MPAATNCSCRWRISRFCPRYGSGEDGAALDRLGGEAWQRRRAPKLKDRIREIANELHQDRRRCERAAHRAGRRGRTRSQPLYAALRRSLPLGRDRGPGTRAIERRDRRSGRGPADGPAGRAAMSVSARPRWRCARAFIAAMAGEQVAVVCTDDPAGAAALHRLSSERFAGFPINDRSDCRRLVHRRRRPSRTRERADRRGPSMS